MNADESEFSTAESRESDMYEEFRNVICFNCQKKKHYANECSNSRQSREMRSSSITTQVILFNRDKQNHLAECVLSDQMIVVTIRSEEIRKKRATAQVKKKKTILKRNERINEKHENISRVRKQNKKRTKKSVKEKVKRERSKTKEQKI